MTGHVFFAGCMLDACCCIRDRTEVMTDRNVSKTVSMFNRPPAQRMHPS